MEGKEEGGNEGRVRKQEEEKEGAKEEGRKIRRERKRRKGKGGIGIEVWEGTQEERE